MLKLLHVTRTPKSKTSQHHEKALPKNLNPKSQHLNLTLKSQTLKSQSQTGSSNQMKTQWNRRLLNSVQILEGFAHFAAIHCTPC